MNRVRVRASDILPVIKNKPMNPVAANARPTSTPSAIRDKDGYEACDSQ